MARCASGRGLDGRALCDPDEARRRVSTTTYDVARISWWFELAQWLAFSVMLAVLWLRSLERWSEMRAVPSRRRAPRPREPLLQRAIRGPEAKIFRWSFDLWIAQSALLALCYMPDAFLYCARIVVNTESRYSMQALTDFAVWGASWVVVTLPLYASWDAWNRVRAAAVARARGAADETLKRIDAAPPVGTVRLIAAQVIAAIAFLLTVMHGIGE